MARQDTTLIGSNTLGASQPVDTLITLINAPGPGRYKVWGSFRHTLADGIKLTSPVAIRFPGTANSVSSFGPFVIDIINNTSGINLALAVATGGSDSASAVIYAEKVNQR